MNLPECVGRGATCAVDGRGWSQGLYQGDWDGTVHWSVQG